MASINMKKTIIGTILIAVGTTTILLAILSSYNKAFEPFFRLAISVLVAAPFIGSGIEILVTDVPASPEELIKEQEEVLRQLVKELENLTSERSEG